MNRLHIHVAVDDLSKSVRFYSTIFGSEPTVLKPDYAKWLVDDPRVNFAISRGSGTRKGIEHLGIQAESSAELAQVYGRLRAADRRVLEEGCTTCCYAKSEKSWIADPDGIVWEAFYTSGDAIVYGDSPALGTLGDSLGDAPCCLPKAAA